MVEIFNEKESRAMARRIARYAGLRCCVCGKFGAQEPMSEPLANLRAVARARSLTLKLPAQNAIHDKCLKQLKALVALKKA